MTEQINARLVEALKLARPHVENDSQRFYDGTMGEFARGAAAGTLKMIDSALAEAEGQAVPGWKLVPVEPTWDMKIAASTAYREARDGHYTARMEQTADCWAAMLAAAPEAPAPAQREPLTAEQINAIYRQFGTSRPDGFEAAVREVWRALGIGDE